MTSSNRTRRTACVLAGIALCVGLASCGSGGSDNGSVTPPATSNVPPASASATVAGFIAYMKTVVSIRDDTGSGLDVSAFVAPTSDTTDPDPTI